MPLPHRLGSGRQLNITLPDALRPALETYRRQEMERTGEQPRAAAAVVDLLVLALTQLGLFHEEAPPATRARAPESPPATPPPAVRKAVRGR